MRILYLCADRGIALDKNNGASAHLACLVRAFVRLGHDVLVLTPSRADEAALGARVVRVPTPYVLADLLADVEREVPRERREAQRARKRVVHALGHAWNNVAVEESLREELARFRPELVFELHSPFGVAGTLTCNRLGVRHVLDVHAPLAWEGATYRGQALHEAAELLEDVALARARRIATNSEEMRALLVLAGVERAKIEVVANGVDLELFRPDGPRERPVGEDDCVVGFSGSLKAWHGIEVLCAAFRQLAADPRYHLLVVGDGPLRKEVARLAAELPGRVTATGALPLERVPALVRAMDVAVAPYPPLERFYFSPLKVLDAMACGVPNVASALGQIPTLVRDGVTGVLVPPGDAQALGAALRRLGGDRSLRARMGAAAARDARESHDWRDRAAELVAFGTRADAAGVR